MRIGGTKDEHDESGSNFHLEQDRYFGGRLETQEHELGFVDKIDGHHQNRSALGFSVHLLSKLGVFLIKKKTKVNSEYKIFYYNYYYYYYLNLTYLEVTD